MIRVAQAEFIDVAQLIGGVALAGRDAHIQQARRLVGQQVEEAVQFAQRIPDQPSAISLSVRSGTAGACPRGRRSQSSGDEFGAPEQREIRCVESCVGRRR